jgi:HK97 family phage major capsid protein
VTITMPDTSEGLLDFFKNNKSGVAEAFANPEAAAAFTEEYAKKVNKRDPDIVAQMQEGIQLGMAALAKANNPDGKGVTAPPVDLSERGRPRIAGREVMGRVPSSAERALWSETAPGTAIDGMFANHAEYFRTVHGLLKGKRLPDSLVPKAQKLEDIRASYGSEVPGDGGFLVPEAFRSDVMQIAIESGVTRPRSTVIPMSTLRLNIPVVDDTSHAASILGGVICFWTEEGASLTESQGSFAAATLDARKLTGFAGIPNELLADAPAFAGFFNASFPKAIAWFEDLGFIKGTGVAEPQGWADAGNKAMVVVSAEPGQLSKTIVWENILEMYARLLPTSLGTAAWVANKDTFRQLMTMGLVVGTGGGPVLIGGLQQSAAGAPPMTMLGLPLILSEKVPSLGSQNDISLVDLSYYLIGDRQQMEISSSEHFFFQNDKTAYKVITRVDGRPWLLSAITPNSNSANSLSAFVTLAARP